MATSKCQINRKLLPVKALYFTFAGGTAAVLPFIPVIAKSIGIPSSMLGVLFACLPFFSLGVVSFVSCLADRYRLHKTVLIATFAVTALTVLSFKFVPSLGATDSANVSLACVNDRKYLRFCTLGGNGFRARTFGFCNLSCNSTDGFLSISEDGAPFLQLNDSAADVYNLSAKPSDFILGDSVECIRFANGDELRTGNNETNETSATLPSVCGKESGLLCKLDCYLNMASTLRADTNVVKETYLLCSYGFWIFVLCVCICFCGGQVIFTFMDAVTYSALGDNRELYGHQRLWGAISWGIVAITTGIVIDIVSKGKPTYDYSPGYYILTIFYVAGMITGSYAKLTPPPKPKNIRKSLKVLLSDAHVIVLLITAIICGGLASVFGNFLFWYLEDMGSSRLLLGICLAINCFAEILVFAFSGKIAAKLGLIHTVSVVFAAFGVRFICLSLIHNPWLALPIEMLHGITFALFYHCLTSYASQVAPPGMVATSQSILGGAYRQLGFAFGSLFGAMLFSMYGGRATFLYLGISAFALGIVHAIAQYVLKKYGNKTNEELQNKLNSRWSDGDAKHSVNGKETEQVIPLHVEVELKDQC